MNYTPTPQTIIFVSIFIIGYLFILIKKTIKNTIDLYDLLLLSSLAIFPGLFVFAPRFVENLAHLIGVEFPFVILFGSLFVCVFIYLYRLIIKVNKQDKLNLLLIQEISLLKQRIEGNQAISTHKTEE
ncbi:MAG: DUF2304 domain-containing protein [Coleofasciculus sp. C1-SOL-03]|uniref:DUF2304 domain-containing protein n=1 Tax=Coleofasciculus sp. C1-SOL-03 TaxID=3069522 RepID=UPI0032F4EE5D